MYREILTHPHIGSYSAAFLAGFIAAYFLARWRAKQNQIEGRHIDNLVLLLLVVCPMGARFFSRLFDFAAPIGIWEAMKIWKGGGLVFYGGMIFGLALVIIYVALTKIPFLQLGDVLAPSLALGLAFGRVGCFLSGCCWGDVCVRPTKLAAMNSTTHYQLQTFPSLSPPDFFLAVQFPPESGAYEQHEAFGLISHKAAHSLPVHPAQLYEAVLVLVICMLLNLGFNQRRARGEILATFAIAYGFARFGVEFFRADTPPIYFGMSVSQVISIGIVTAGLALFIFARKLGSSKPQNLSARETTLVHQLNLVR
jgi:phosphatidylglycerol---prolipoprotein diacylglyceryl transferase